MAVLVCFRDKKYELCVVATSFEKSHSSDACDFFYLYKLNFILNVAKNMIYIYKNVIVPPTVYPSVFYPAVRPFVRPSVTYLVNTIF